MTAPQTCLYLGDVVHKRLRPVRHVLRYRVFNVFIAVDELEALSGKSRILGYNRHRPLGICDRHHGNGGGSPISRYLQDLASCEAGIREPIRFFMFCYPSMFGYVFNPLTVYYGYDNSNRLRLMVYEVNNTFGGRRNYVVPVGDSTWQKARKSMRVSPFNPNEGSYGFHPSRPCETLSLGITLRIGEEPVMKAYFSGKRHSLDDPTLVKCMAAMPLQAFKVVAAIHWEAAKLWLKGMKTSPRPNVPPAPASRLGRTS